MSFRAIVSVGALALISGSALGVNLLAVGYSENFNSMGAAGTTPPAGYTIKVGATGTSNATWSTSTGITAAGVAALINTTGPLTASAGFPSTTNNNGFNAPAYNGGVVNSANRAIALSPTTVSGAAIELALTNSTGSAISTLNLSYDIQRYTAASSSNELPGYWLFISLNGTTWTEATNFRSSITSVPNSAGVSAVSDVLNLGSSVANGATFYIRWVDDNAIQTSPDQIIGLDNVNITVPAPASAALIGLAALAAGRRRR